MGVRRQSILSAYLDDELSPRRRARVEAALALNPALREELDQLRRLVSRVQGLAQVSLPEPIRQDIMKRLSALPPLTSDELTAEEIELLLAAYAYGELNDLARDDVERLLLPDEQHRETVEEFRRVRDMMQTLPQQPIPSDILAVVLDRLHQSAERMAQVAKTARIRRPIGEYLSAYLDGEISPRKRAEIERRLAANTTARQTLGSLDWVRTNLSALPRVTAPTGILSDVLSELSAEKQTAMASNKSADSSSDPSIDLSWVEPASVPTGRPGRFFRWDAFFLAAASVLVIVSIGGLVANLPPKNDTTLAKHAAPTHDKSAVNHSPAPVAPVVAENKKSPDDLRDQLAPAGLAHLTEILEEKPERMIERIDRKQVTLTTSDVNKVLDIMGLTGQAKRYNETDNRQVVDIKGPASDVSRVLSRVEEVSRRSDLVQRIGIDDPHHELLARLDRPEHRSATPTGPLQIDIVESVRQGIEELAKLSNKPETSPTVDEPVIVNRDKEEVKQPIKRSSTSLRLPNEPTVIAKPLRVLLVVEPAKAGK